MHRWASALRDLAPLWVLLDPHLPERSWEIVRVGGLFTRVRKAASQTVIAKRQATAEFDSVFPWVAQTVEGAFRVPASAISPTAQVFQEPPQVRQVHEGRVLDLDQGTEHQIQ